MENQKTSAHTIYLIFDWAYDNDHVIDVTPFTDEDKARVAFKNLIAREKRESWIANEQTATDANGNPEEGSLVIDEDTDTDFYAFIQGRESNQYTSIKLTIV